MNLKHGRGPVPDDVRAAFRELCRRPKVGSVLELIDAATAPLETAAVHELKDAHREVAALRQEAVTPERLGEAAGPDLPDEAAERVAGTCCVLPRRLGKVDEALGRLDFSGRDTAATPSSFRRLLECVEDDPGENIPEEGLVAACDRALRGFEQLAGQAVARIRGVVDARREVEAGEWNDAAVGHIRTVVRHLEHAHRVLDGDGLPIGRVEAARKGLKELDEERQSADPLAATTREVLGRIEAADLPLPVLTRALNDIRMSQSAGREAPVQLERLRLVLDLPWTARAGERVDIAAAMAELDAAHAGRAALKERVRRFLATRQLTATTWTVEGRSSGDRSRGGNGSAPAALRRLVVRPACSSP